jgi:hypothetical protein
MPSDPAASTVPSGADADAGRTWAAHSFTRCPATVAVRPGTGSNARIRRSMTSAGSPQSTRVSAPAILAA